MPTLELQLKYAWDWFEYHAGQRLTAFNFFLVLMGAVIVGYAQALIHHSKTLGVALGVLGGLVALAFWAMDIRNEELVDYGRSALDDLEEKLGMSIRKDEAQRTQLGRVLDGRTQRHIYQWALAKKTRMRWFSHGRWLRIVITVMGCSSLAGAGWAGAGF